jgi:flagellar basal-body rod protein FlgG
MIYGLYLSATGIMTNAYRQDVIANNLANAETDGFKKDVPLFKQRLTAAQENHKPGDWSDPTLEKLGGGLFLMPTRVNHEQGPLEQTSNPLDVAIEGDGFFGVQTNGQTRLTRDGRFTIDSNGNLVLPEGAKVLDAAGQPLVLSRDQPTSIGKDGVITQGGKTAGRIGLFDVPDRAQLKKLGKNLFAPSDANQLKPGTGTLHAEFVERSNVDPTSELTELMDAQRQLEANANMIRVQDSTLQRLVNDVGKIS